MDESIAQDDQVFAGKSVRGMFEGPIPGLLARLAFPVFTGMFFQLLYSLVDTLYISRIDLADPSYVGGTGMVFPLIFIIIALSSGLLIFVPVIYPVFTCVDQVLRYAVRQTRIVIFSFTFVAVGILWVRGYFGRVLEGKGR
jgi:Na+-driven multidrug efflux pump